MDSALTLSLLALGLFFGMLAFSELGRRIGLSYRERDPENLDKGIASAEAAVFGLLGLLVAFTFSGAASRFEDRRHLVTAEANAIGTAYLRLDLLPGEPRSELRALLRTYTDTRIATYRTMGNRAATQAKLDEGAALQGEIWAKSVAATQRPDAPSQATMLLLPALNDMFDITTTRQMATRNHPPLIIFALLGGLSLLGALLAGFDTSVSKERRWLHTLVFAAIMSFAVNVIAELEFPRLGLVRVDAADDVLIELRNTMR